MLYSPLSMVYRRLQVSEAREILACQTCATRIKGTCTVIIKATKYGGNSVGKRHERSALERSDTVVVWTVSARTYFSVRVRWNPNKAKSNSIHWLCQRVEPTKSFRNYSADCIVSQISWLGEASCSSHRHRGCAVHLPPLSSALQHKQSRYGAATRPRFTQ